MISRILKAYQNQWRVWVVWTGGAFMLFSIRWPILLGMCHFQKKNLCRFREILRFARLISGCSMLFLSDWYRVKWWLQKCGWSFQECKGCRLRIWQTLDLTLQYAGIRPEIILKFLCLRWPVSTWCRLVLVTAKWAHDPPCPFTQGIWPTKNKVDTGWFNSFPRLGWVV